MPPQCRFHLCDTAGYLFGTTAEVHPAEFIQLRLQMVYFTLPVAQLFLQPFRLPGVTFFCISNTLVPTTY